ncbi:sensory neuron membrane protein 2-like [Onthophagus taurus]|uniref:sensory neuron membrane protein 2-like n=1 Tax=Onthophagus taurus TaxID=166361 RepID=UPI0039BE5D5A
MNCRSWVILILSLVGAILIVIGAVLGFKVLPDYVHDQIAEQVRLEDDTEQFERWRKLPVDMAFKVYIFEITNPEEVIAGTEKPNVKERGPYVYNESREKTGISRNKTADTLTYKQYQQYSFNKEASGINTEEDEFYVLNTPLIGAFQTIDLMGGFGSLVNDVWEGAFSDHQILGPFIKIKVKDYLFGGLVFCTDLTNSMCGLVTETSKQMKNLEITPEGYISFSFFKFKQNAHDGEYVIKAGMDVVEDLGLIENWEQTTKLDTWEDDGECNTIRGRDSSIYPPYIEEEDEFDIYSTDICRVVRLEYKREEEYKGVTGQRRHLKQDTLTNTGSNSCFCTKYTATLEGSRDECLPNGFVDLFTCLKASVILSFPHFLWADKDTAATVTGLTPDEDKHITFVNVEPGTGYPLQGSKRVQFNMILRPIKGIDMTQTLTPAMVPLIWIDEGVELTDDLIDELDEKYLSKLVLVDAVTWTLIAVGIVLFLVFGCWFIFKKKK